MKFCRIIIIALPLILLLGCASSSVSDKQIQEYYQLTIYTLENEQQVAATDNYLKEAFLPALNRQGIPHVGVFKLRPESKDSLDKIYILTPYSSLSSIESTHSAINNDESFVANGSLYLTAGHEKPPYLRIENIILKAFKDMPIMQVSGLEGPRENRIYELRSYESPTEAYFKNKLHMFNEGGEITLFEKLEFNAVFYGEVMAGPKMPNLMYMTTFSDQESRDAHWKLFVDSPEWSALKVMPEYQNNVSHIDITFLYPTSYSDY